MIETISPYSFDMGKVMCNLERGCGSIGCVIGWAAQLKLFPELKNKKNYLGIKTPHVFADGEWSEINYFIDVNMAAFLGLNHSDDMGVLFGDDADVGGPIQKAAQIRTYVQEQLLRE